MSAAGRRTGPRTALISSARAAVMAPKTAIKITEMIEEKPVTPGVSEQTERTAHCAFSRT